MSGHSIQASSPPLPANKYQPDAFASRRALMPMWDSQPVDPQQWVNLWQQMQATPLETGSLAYIHIPFCASHCVFCGFYRNGWQEQRAADYASRLQAELASTQAGPAASIGAIYFGGGTPTLLSAGQLSTLLSQARASLPVHSTCEITIEGRTSRFDDEKISACLEAGANRFSFGIQTFDSALRRRLGRSSDGATTQAYLHALRRKTDRTLVLDLMFGLPGQSDQVWLDDLAIASTLDFDGLDIYAFNAFPGLPLMRMVEKGALPALPGIADQARQYALAVRYLRQAGWQQISNSHFARTPAERNVYNSAIKSGRNCLAFGSGAGGKQAGYSYQIEPDLQRYLDTPIADKPLSHIARQGSHTAFTGQIQGAFEQGFLPADLLTHLPAQTELLATWQRQSLLESGPAGIRLTTAGRFWAPSMTRELILQLTGQGANHAHHRNQPHHGSGHAAPPAGEKPRPVTGTTGHPV